MKNKGDVRNHFIAKVLMVGVSGGMGVGCVVSAFQMFGADNSDVYFAPIALLIGVAFLKGAWDIAGDTL